VNIANLHENLHRNLGFVNVGCMEQAENLLAFFFHKMNSGDAETAGMLVLSSVWLQLEISLKGIICGYNKFFNKLLF
jgi:hypothetical protein